MENLTDYSQYTEYKVSVVMWKVVAPFILALGTFGNVATILVMSRIKDNNSSQYAILMALAMTDLCLLYSGQFIDWLRFGFGVYVGGFHDVLCRFHMWVLFSSNTMSAWLVTTVTVQRTMAVLWPHRMRMMCTVRRTWIVIAVVVTMALSVHLHMTIAFHLDETNNCDHTIKYLYYHIWPWVDMCISSILPSICLLVCCSILSRTLFRSASLLSTTVAATSNAGTDQFHGDRKGSAVKVTIMILALSCTFLVLTLPVCICNLLLTYISSTPKMEAFYKLLIVCVYNLWYTNSAVNFLLYCITGSRFRKEFLSLLSCGARSRPAGETTAATPIGGRTRNCEQQLSDRHHSEATSRRSSYNSENKCTIWSATLVESDNMLVD